MNLSALDEPAASPTRMYFPVGMAPGDFDALPSGADLSSFCLDIDSQRDHYLTQKRIITQRPGRGPLRVDSVVAQQAVHDVERFVRARMRELPAFAPDTERLERLTLDDLMFELQEDLVIMQISAGHAPERARALYMHVCFPGGWDPAQLLGKSFTGLHARVPYEPGFDRVERKAQAGLLFQAPAARYVWSVTAEPSLDRHPQTPRLVDFRTTTELFLRVERQIMLPLSEAAAGTTALFLIRTYVYGRDRLSQAQRATLAEAVARMSEATLRYKGMFGHTARVLELLS
ncbi:MAG TPA: heme-dependent oxidative N-demethylase subunit alpha family protein [Polyangiales bacterium]|nr:heme-dependent oxidative N-demethylase subunit alpha family protein [Polyangiales bacterium]